MRILICGINYAPDLVGIAKYTTELAEWLAERGHVVRVVTAPPYYPEWKIPPGYGGLRYCHNRDSGVNVYRCPIYVPSSPNGVKRLLHLASFSISSMPVLMWSALSFRPQIVISVAPALLSAPVARLSAALCGARSWLHIQDFEVDAAFELGFLRGRMLRQLAVFTERVLLRSFDRISSISPKMVLLLSKKGCDLKRTYELRNWVDVASIRPLADQNTYRDRLGLDASDVLVLYSGTIGEKQGMEILVDAARLLAGEQHIHFLVVGDGPGRTRLETIATGLANIHFMHLQPVKKLNMLLSAADIHVLPQRVGAEDLVLPSKLMGMLASGRPVVATAGHETGVATEIAGRGVVVRPGDGGALAAAISRLAADPAQRNLLGQAARRYAEESLDRSSVLIRLEECLLKLVQGKAA